MAEFLRLVGNRIRTIRKAADLTQEELAEICGLQYTYIGGIERGERNVSLQTIETLAKGLNIAPYELLKFDDLYTREEFKEKETIIEILNSTLWSRSTDEIVSVQKILKEIFNLTDIKKNT